MLEIEIGDMEILILGLNFGLPHVNVNVKI